MYMCTVQCACVHPQNNLFTYDMYSMGLVMEDEPPELSYNIMHNQVSFIGELNQL